jgi:hypothetical protein
VLGFGVERRGRLVEDEQQRPVTHEPAGERRVRFRQRCEELPLVPRRQPAKHPYSLSEPERIASAFFQDPFRQASGRHESAPLP